MCFISAVVNILVKLFELIFKYQAYSFFVVTIILMNIFVTLFWSSHVILSMSHT